MKNKAERKKLTEAELLQILEAHLEGKYILAKIDKDQNCRVAIGKNTTNMESCFMADIINRVRWGSVPGGQSPIVQPGKNAPILKPPFMKK